MPSPTSHAVFRSGLSLLAAFALGLAGCGDDPPPDPPPSGLVCPVEFSFRPTMTATSVLVMGEWNAFDRVAHPLNGPDERGYFTGTFSIPPGEWGYAFLVGGVELLDPANPNKVQRDGEQYSLITVADCHKPNVKEVADSRHVSRSGAGRGALEVNLLRVAGAEETSLPNLEGTLERGDENGCALDSRPLEASEFSGDAEEVALNLTDLADGNYTVSVRAVGTAGSSQPLVIRFSIVTPASERPTVRVKAGTLSNARPAAGQGAFSVQVETTKAFGISSAVTVKARLRSPDDALTTCSFGRELTPNELATGDNWASATIHLSGLADGKYRVTLEASQGTGMPATLVLPFWIEAEKFDWRRSPIYMLMIDRFRDGDPSSNAKPTAGVPTSADFQGGDLQGVEAAIREGYFDSLGVKAIWLTPWQTQPDTWHPEMGGTKKIMGYHGYWPVKAREVDARFGGNAALASMVREAHKHGIRIIMDSVANHVSVEHEYFADPAKKDKWFRTGCNCGSGNGCGWDDTPGRYYCLFNAEMPDINWNVPEAKEQFISDFAWWGDTCDIDGLRGDAAKHMEPDGIKALATHMRNRYEQAGTKMLMYGESYTGNVDFLKEGMGPDKLDSQLDFPRWFAVPEPVFGRDANGLKTARDTVNWSNGEFGDWMVTFIGSHDDARFITKADEANRDKKGNKWEWLPEMPTAQRPYDRTYMAFLHLLTTPGIPLVYYGDEYGEWGGSDPDNRHFFKPESTLNTQQSGLLTRLRKVLEARAKLRGLGTGSLHDMWCNPDQWGASEGSLMAYARIDSDPKHSAIIVLNLKYESWTGVGVTVPSAVGWQNGTVIDAISGKEYSLANGSTTVDVEGRGGVILHLK